MFMAWPRASEKSERTSVSQCGSPRGSKFKLVESTGSELVQAKVPHPLKMQLYDFLRCVNLAGQASSGGSSYYYFKRVSCNGFISCFHVVQML